MNIYEVLFLIQFLVVLAVTGFKIINIVNIAGVITEKDSRVRQAKKDSVKGYIYIFLTFGLYLIAWFIGLTIMLLQTDTLLYSSLMVMENLLLIFNIVMVISELVFMFSAGAMQQVQAFSSSGR